MPSHPKAASIIPDDFIGAIVHGERTLSLETRCMAVATKLLQCLTNYLDSGLAGRDMVWWHLMLSAPCSRSKLSRLYSLMETYWNMFLPRRLTLYSLRLILFVVHCFHINEVDTSLVFVALHSNLHLFTSTLSRVHGGPSQIYPAIPCLPDIDGFSALTMLDVIDVAWHLPM